MLSRSFVIFYLLLSLFIYSSCTTPVTTTIQTPDAFIQTNDENLKNADYAGVLLESGKALARNPRDADAWVHRGVALSCLGDSAGALNNYNQALLLKPQMVVAYQNRGSVYVQMGDFVKAIADFTTCIRLAPRDSVGYYNRGVAYKKQGAVDQAIADFNQAISLDPKEALHYLVRGAAKLLKGEYADAIDDYSRVLDFAPQYAATAYIARGNAYLAWGNYKQAMADFERAMATPPALHPSSFECANVNVLMGKFEEAIADFEKGLKQKPLEKSSRFIYALTLLRLHQAVWPAGLARVVPKWKQEWTKDVGRYLLGELSEADFLALARQGDEKSAREHSCEAFYYAGMMHLIGNEPEIARGLFERCLATNVKGFVEYTHARVELVRLGDKR